MTDNLVERIDARAHQGIAATPFNLLMDAKERIEALTAERDGLLRCVTDNHVALCRAEKAEAERDRLREALAMIDAIDPEHHIDGCALPVVRGLVLRMGETARAALKGESHE